MRRVWAFITSLSRLGGTVPPGDIMARIIDATDSLVTHLNAGICSFSQTFTAERLYVPIFELKDMVNLHVSVVPRLIDSTSANRLLSQFDFEIDIGVQKKLNIGTNAEIDPLMDFIDEIYDCIRQKRIFGTAAWVRTVNNPLIVSDHLLELRQFTSVLTVTLRMVN